MSYGEIDTNIPGYNPLISQAITSTPLYSLILRQSHFIATEEGQPDDPSFRCDIYFYQDTRYVCVEAELVA